VAIVTTAPLRASTLNAHLPGSVDAWFEHALARDPANRFATAREMTDSLRTAFSSISGVMSLPPEPSGPVLSQSGPRSTPSSGGADGHAKTERVERVATPIELDATQRQDPAEPAALARSEPARDKADLSSTTQERAAARSASRRNVALVVGAIIIIFGVAAFVTVQQGGVASSSQPSGSGTNAGKLPASAGEGATASGAVAAAASSLVAPPASIVVAAPAEQPSAAASQRVDGTPKVKLTSTVKPNAATSNAPTTPSATSPQPPHSAVPRNSSNDPLY
jgi:serine/threonine-protein kinase